MKTIYVTIALMVMSTGLFAQNGKLDEIFNKFQGKDGITSVALTGDLFKFASEMDSGMNSLKNITQVRVLSLEKALAQDIVTFEGMVKDMSLTGYKELMVVKENKNNVRMLAREDKGRWNDFVLLVTGDKNHVLVNVQGSISPSELHSLSKSMHVEGMACVNKLK